MTTAIILAGGRSTRMGGDVDKAFLSVGAKPVLAWSLLAFERAPLVDRIVLVVRKEQILAAKAIVKMFGVSKIEKIVPGGAIRQESVQAGLAACDLDTRVVVIHDAARPCVTSELVAQVVQAVKRVDAVTVGRAMTDTVKRVAATKGAVVQETVARDRLWTVQTPQAFQFSVLKAAYKKLKPGIEVTDDCQVVELAGGTVKLLEYQKPNFKVTTPDDVNLISLILR